NDDPTRFPVRRRRRSQPGDHGQGREQASQHAQHGVADASHGQSGPPLRLYRRRRDQALMTAGRIRPLAFVDEGLGNSSYLLDLGDGRALVVDPERDAAPYLDAAEGAGLSLAFTVETHLHADFLTGSRELVARGATVLAPRAGEVEWPHRGFDHSDELDV